MWCLFCNISVEEDEATFQPPGEYAEDLLEDDEDELDAWPWAGLGSDDQIWHTPILPML